MQSSKIISDEKQASFQHHAIDDLEVYMEASNVSWHKISVFLGIAIQEIRNSLHH